MRIYRGITTCLGCMNLVMSGKNEEGKAKVRCEQSNIQRGKPVLLSDIIDGEYGVDEKCIVRNGAGPLLPRGTTWADHVEKLRRRYC